MTYGRDSRTFRLTVMTSALALALAGCSSGGRTRLASIGDVPGDTSGTGGGDTGAGNDTGNTGGGDMAGGGNTSGGGGGNTSGGNTGGGTAGGGGTGGGSQIAVAGPLLVTAGNAVIGLGDKHAGLAGNVNGALPASGAVTGKVTAVLRRTGQTLVDLGNGRSAVLNRAGGAVGQLVSIDVGNGRVIGAPTGSSLVGVSALTPTQLAQVTVANPGIAPGGTLGQVATVANAATGALTGGNPVGSVPGIASTVTGGLPGGLSGSGSANANLATSVASTTTAVTGSAATPVTGVITAVTGTISTTPVVAIPVAVPVAGMGTGSAGATVATPVVTIPVIATTPVTTTVTGLTQTIGGVVKKVKKPGP